MWDRYCGSKNGTDILDFVSKMLLAGPVKRSPRPHFFKAFYHAFRGLKNSGKVRVYEPVSNSNELMRTQSGVLVGNPTEDENLHADASGKRR